MDTYPFLILLFSGKRKSGKDYVTDILIDRLGHDKTAIIKISAPIKSYWAKNNNLSLEELLSAGAMKEQHRQQMIEWSEEQRKSDYGIFCREAIRLSKAYEKPIWIVSDVRRKTDTLWFNENFAGKIKTVRIVAPEQSRKDRGWSFTPGIDDAETECNLDDVDKWNFVVNNDGNKVTLEKFFQVIQEQMNDILKTKHE